MTRQSRSCPPHLPALSHAHSSNNAGPTSLLKTRQPTRPGSSEPSQQAARSPHARSLCASSGQRPRCPDHPVPGSCAVLCSSDHSSDLTATSMLVTIGERLSPWQRQRLYRSIHLYSSSQHLLLECIQISRKSAKTVRGFHRPTASVPGYKRLT